MVSSLPSSPEAPRQNQRPQSTYGVLQSSPDGPKSRPQSMMYKAPPRSQSRMSQNSKQGNSRASDEDGKTSVRVVVRVRPPLGPSDPGYDLIPQRFQRSMVQVTTPTSLGVDSPQGRKLFIFDRVFGEDTKQKGVWEYLEDSVDSFLQGYNVSILAYGQSGSGKSHTMGTSGPEEQRDLSTKGVIPRAAQHLFENLEDNSASHSRQNSGLKTPTRFSVNSINQILQNSKSNALRKWEMSITYVEIYNEQPRDLLLPEATPLSERPNVQIREDTKGRIFVEGLKSVTVNSIDELMGVLNHGSTIRQTDATAINARSSRSHAVFTINLRQTKSSGGPVKDKRASVPVEILAGNDSPITVESKLHFVDLAGSERLKNTGATGDRAKEGISINAGLASLGKVISQLSSRSSNTYISYRDSKLTRMLQDSLGGNAITYMIACITPAEFHLSETLNTVQYAQRARNIQSKPRIQQVQDDADKQAVIDRLRSEVAFLRQQIRSAEGGDRRGGTHDRFERPNERENELQNQLLDVQESYSTLSQRHAKLISELARSGDVGDQFQAAGAVGESAVDRLKRSQAHQQQIEQMVLEYEKTIQSLEANLSNTRGSLATTESSLLERETKCAYAETMNTQLNTRVQKLMDRESNMEQYVHDLEARLEDHSSGSEKNDAIVTDLRKEITRIRESETNAEDYICTLEERLAESDQDMEILQREVERLEHLVERQRSLGKLDNLLYELDHVQKKSNNHQRPSQTPAKSTRVNDDGLDRERDLDGAEKVQLPNEDDNDLSQIAEVTELSDGHAQTESDGPGLQQLQKATALTPAKVVRDVDQDEPSPAQTKFMAEKFESVSQELFDLRLEHDSTMNDLDLLSAKYQEALRTLAEMQDSIDEARHAPRQKTAVLDTESRPESSLEDARAMENGGHVSSSRSLSSELSLAGESPTTTDTDITPVSKQPASGEVATKEIERLQNLLAEHEQGLTDMSEQYAQLQAEHNDTLSTVEKLRSEIQKARPASPNNAAGMFRRMASQTGSGVDRGQRSIVQLRSILAEELDDKPERLEGAEVHLSAATNELANRNDRIQSLEAELKNAKKEMDMKTTIISGLTRERNSMKAGSPVDLSMVSQMRDQLIQKETELKSLHENYARREQVLQDELRSERSRQSSPMLPSSPGNEEKLHSLERKISEITIKHKEALQSHEVASRELQVKKSELSAALASIETMKTQQSTGEGDSVFNRAAAATAFQHERENYEDLINDLKDALQEQQKQATSQKEQINELIQLHAQAGKATSGLAEQLKSREREIAEMRPQLDVKDQELQEARSAVEFHKHGLKSLHEAHANEVEEMKLSHAGILAGYDDQMADVTARYEKLQKQQGSSTGHSRNEIDGIVHGAQKVLGHPTTADMLVNHIQDMVEEKQAMATTVKRLNATNTELERQLTGRQNLQELEEENSSLATKIGNYQETIRNLANEIGNHEETIRDKDKAIKKVEKEIATLKEERDKKSTIVEELEQQLQASFDQHHNRVSVIQAQGNQALVEAQQRIALLEKDLDHRRSFIDSEPSRTNTMKSTQRPQSPPTEGAQRANSLSSNLRKSASIASLPSPPPAVPLPPLPTLPGIATSQPSNPSPPQSRHTSKEVTPVPVTPANNRDTNTTNAALRRQSALIEEQEGRIRQIEKHLHAEKQLTATLEEALVDLETQSNKLRADAEGWKKKAWAMEEEIGQFRKEKKSERLSVQAMEEEVKKRREAEAARAQLEERMKLLQEGGGGYGSGGKKKRKGGGLNCF